MSNHIGTGLIAGGLAHHEGVGSLGSVGTGFVASELAQHTHTGNLGSLATGVGSGLTAGALTGHQHHHHQHQANNFGSGLNSNLGTGLGTGLVAGGLTQQYNQHTQQYNQPTQQYNQSSLNPIYETSTGFSQPSSNFVQSSMPVGLGQTTFVGPSTTQTTLYEPTIGTTLPTTTYSNSLPTTGIVTQGNHHAYHQGGVLGKGLTGTGFGNHEVYHGNGIGGIGTGLATISSNVSTNPNYLNQTGFNATGLSNTTLSSNTIPTTTGGFPGNVLSNELQKNSHFGTTALNPNYNNAPLTTTTTATTFNDGTNFVKQHPASTMDKIKAKLHIN